MKNTKKIVLLLIICTIIGQFSIFQNVSTAYTGRTRQQALDWAMSQRYKFIDYDNAYGAQCTDLIYAYYDYLIGRYVKGNARDFIWNELPAGWARFPIEQSYPQPGDIVVVGPNQYSEWGHVAIVVSFDGQRLQVLDQNYGGQNHTGNVVPVDIRPFSISMFSHIIRPDFPAIAPDYSPYGQEVSFEYDFIAAIKHINSGRFVTNQNGALRLNYEYGLANEQFQFAKLPNGGYKITSLYDGKCLDASFANYYNSYVQTAPFNGSASQTWRFYKKDGNYVIKADSSNAVLDISGDNLVLNTSSGAQAFTFLMQRPSANLGADFLASINSYNNYAITSTGSYLQTAIPTGVNNQLFRFTRLANGAYKITSQIDGKSLEVAWSSPAANTAVVTSAYVGSPAQTWRIYKKDNSYMITADCTPCVLDVYTNSYSGETTVMMNDVSGLNTQLFNINTGSLQTMNTPVLNYRINNERGSVNFYWQDVGNENYYNLTVSKTDGTPWTQNYRLNANELSKEIPLGTGQYRAILTAVSGFEEKSGTPVVFTVGGQYINQFSIPELNYTSQIYPQKIDYNPKKEWNIRFNHRIFIDNGNNVYILDEEGRVLKSDVVIRTADTLTVIPIDPYIPYKNYYIYIKRNAVSGENNRRLQKDVLFKFNIIY